MTAQGRILILNIVFIVTVRVATASPADPSAKDVETLFKHALAAEQAEQWDTAVDYFLKCHLSGRRTPEVRKHLHDGLRRAAQIRRQRDPLFQRHILALPPSESLDLYADVIGKLESHYAEREKCRPERLFALGLEELDRALSDEVFRQTHLPGVDPAKLAKYRRSFADLPFPATAKEARANVRELARLAQKDLGLTNVAAIVLECLCGACGGLDESTAYLSPLQTQAENASPAAILAAYGIRFLMRDGSATVDGVLPESWAVLQTPLKAGDRILRANGRPVDGEPDVFEAAFRNPGERGHDLDILSPTLVSVSVRLPTPVPTVLRAEIRNPFAGVGYIKLGAFRETTANELERAILSLKSIGMRSLVLDLRGNGGGSFPAGVQVAERFLPAGVIATTQGQANAFASRVFSSDSGMTAFDVPLVVLVDAKTMSAAEVVASALKDHRRATFVGTTTFGKGAIQSPIHLTTTDENPPITTGTLTITTARIFTSAGLPLHGVGVTPDLVEANPQRQLAIALQRAAELVIARP